MSKRIHSPKLFLYLEQSGALNGTDEAIAVAKKEYRKLYQRSWATEKQSIKRELRPLFNEREFSEIKTKAGQMGMTPTKLLRESLLATLNNTQPLPHKEMLLQALQCLTMANIALDKCRYAFPFDTQEFNKQIKELGKAEQLFIDYMQSH